MKNYIFILFFLTKSILNYAQQDAQLSQYMFNKIYFNPATVGENKDWISFSALHRSQWVGYSSTFDDSKAPTNQIISIQTPIIIADGNDYFGLGLHLVNDYTANQLNTLEIQLSLAYHLKLKIGQLSIGLRAGAYKRSLNTDKFRCVDTSDLLCGNNGVVDQIKPDFALGVYYHTTSFFLGGSINHIQKSDFTDVIDGEPVSLGDLEIHGWFMTGLTIKYSQSLTFSPSLIVKTDMNTYSVEGSLIATINDNYYAGISMREADAAVILLGINNLAKNRLKVGYAFDLVLNAADAKSKTSHEIMLAYNIKPFLFFRPRIPIRTPRFRFFETQ